MLDHRYMIGVVVWHSFHIIYYSFHITSSMLWISFRVYLLIGKHMDMHTHIFSRIRPIYADLRDSLFVAINVDDISCLHMALSPLLR